MSPLTRPLPKSATRPQWARLLLIAAAALPAAAIAWGAAQEKAAAPATPPAESKPAEYVGSTTCQTCHEDVFNAFQKNPHHSVETNKKRGWETKACESCHGPGSKHAESASADDIQNPAKLKNAEVDRGCLKCHSNQPTHIGRIQSGHARNQVSCIQCHSIHKNGPNGLTARKPAAVNAQCAGCHNAQWASFQRPFKHRLPEGAMSCVDCHNPHGSLQPKMMQTVRSNQPGCLKCHGDKAGPFTFEHAPMRLDGCGACHEPHGSANPKMLVRREVRQVCLECHTNLPQPTRAAGAPLGTVPPGFHDLRSPRYRNCTLCHIKVHGSYVDRALTK
jgi:DmsE family decaheme c-type cytochrome